MENMEIYKAFRSVPDNAKKTINAGKLKGFTDINPMWRIKMLTEQFGACGFGWYIESEEHWTESLGTEIAVFCKVILKVKHPETNEWSAPIIGIGGSKLSGKGKGDGIDDEAYKMAYTDAISIACKALGMAADVYYEKDRTKYNSYVEPSKAAPQPQSLSVPPQQESKPIMHQQHEKWYAILQTIASGQYTLEQYKKKYYFPEADEIAAKNWILEHQN